MRYATLNGFKCRWDTELVSFEQDEKGVTTTLLDKISQTTLQVRSRYLFGADGARSKIVRQAQIPLIRRPGQGFAVNVLMHADMSHLMEHRKGNLHWILQPNLETPEWGWIGCMRMVKPWYEWLCIIFTTPDAPREVRSEEEYVKRIREMIGDDSVEVKVLGVSTWAINETAAEYYTKGNVSVYSIPNRFYFRAPFLPRVCLPTWLTKRNSFCLGDAVHRHPPNHGLGSNTCIQDAHNLAWKINFVEKGKWGT